MSSGNLIACKSLSKTPSLPPWGAFCVVNKCRVKFFIRDTHYRKRGWELGVRDWDRDRVSKGNFQTDTDSDSQPGEQHRAQGEREGDNLGSLLAKLL